MSLGASKRKGLERVLLVEDEEDIQRIVKLSLERVGGMVVLVCGDPKLALQMAREATPDLILLDYVMPGLDGATLFKQFQEDLRLARIPVVFLTASASGVDARMLRSLGAAGVLSKPFDVHSLPQRILEVWNELAS